MQSPACPTWHATTCVPSRARRKKSCNRPNQRFVRTRKEHHVVQIVDLFGIESQSFANKAELCTQEDLTPYLPNKSTIWLRALLGTQVGHHVRDAHAEQICDLYHLLLLARRAQHHVVQIVDLFGYKSSCVQVQSKALQTALFAKLCDSTPTVLQISDLYATGTQSTRKENHVQLLALASHACLSTLCQCPCTCLPGKCMDIGMSRCKGRGSRMCNIEGITNLRFVIHMWKR